MSPRTFTDQLVIEVPVLRHDESVRDAVQKIVDSGMPGLPVVNDDRTYAGVFGEREFITALFPGYLNQLHYAGFVPKSLEPAFEKRAACGMEPVERHMNTDHVDVGPDYSDAQVAEIFLHHRVLIVPVCDGGQVRGVITRHGFFERLAERFLSVG